MVTGKVAKEKTIESFLRPVLRRASLRWWARNRALENARVGRGEYACAACGEIFRKKEVHVDHLETVIPIDGEFSDWNTFISRLFCQPDKLQILCVNCHDHKTNLENNMRDIYKQKKRESRKKK